MEAQIIQLKEGVIQIIGMSWKEEQFMRQWLTGVKVEHYQLGSSIFVRTDHKDTVERCIEHMNTNSF